MTREWQLAAVGGTTGLLLGGVGSSYAPDIVKIFSGEKENGETETDVKEQEDSPVEEMPEERVDDAPETHVDDAPVKEPAETVMEKIEVSSAVNDDMSFTDAFAAARADVGPGGAFYWHGGVYGTYYKDEWTGMDAEQKAMFSDRACALFPEADDPETAIRPQDVEDLAENVSPQVNSKDLHSEDVAEANLDQLDPEVAVGTRDASAAAAEAPSRQMDELPETGEDPQPETEAEVDPQIIGHTTVYGHLASEVDVDGDGVADVLLVDADDSHDVSSNDVLIDGSGNVFSMEDEYLGNLHGDAQGEDQQANNDGQELAVVGYGEYDGHLTVGVDTIGDGQTDTVVIDVDDNGVISPDDVVVTDNGASATVGELSQAVDAEEESEEAEDDTNDDLDNAPGDDDMDGVMDL